MGDSKWTSRYCVWRAKAFRFWVDSIPAISRSSNATAEVRLLLNSCLENLDIWLEFVG